MSIELFVLTFVVVALFGQKVLKYISFLRNEMDKRRRRRNHMPELRVDELAKLFGSAIVSLAIYTVFVGWL